MTLAIKRHFILCMVCLAALTGCSKGSNQQKQDVVLDAYRMIDEQRTDEAISLLEKSLEEEPQNYEYQSVLASAYAHKSGIRVQKLVPVIQETSKNNLPGLSFDLNSSEDVGFKVARVLVQVSRYFKIFSAIPEVETQNVIYLEHSIALLNKLGNKIKKEDALYRTVLEVILFKHVLSNGLIGTTEDSGASKNSTCQADIYKINQVISYSGKLLIDIFHDVGFVFPDQAESMKSLAHQTSQTLIDLSSAITTVTSLDQAANLFLKQSILENGFGKIMKCNGP